MDKVSVGLDIGHSAVKIVTGKFRDSFPAAATPAISLSAPGSAKKAEPDTVAVGKQKWFVGKTAILHTLGHVPDGLRDDWIETAEHKALLKAGYERAIHAAGAANAVAVALGLPSRLHSRQHARLREIAALTLQIDQENITVLPQPMAAYFDAVATAEGKPRTGKAEVGTNVVVIDIGYYTTDFGATGDGGWAERGSQSMQGISSAAESLRRMLAEEGMEISVRDCDAVLRSRSVKYDGKVRDVSEQVSIALASYADTIAERAMQLFEPDLHKADNLIVVGGGAGLVAEDLHRRWPHAQIPDDPRFAVASGLFKFGLMEG